MRRLVGCLLVLFIVGTLSAQAQAPIAVAGRLSLGPYAGLNYATIAGPDAGDQQYHADFALGVQLDYDLPEGALFRTGLIYSRRGTENTESGITNTTRLSYVEVPLLFGYQFPATTFRPYVLGGLNIGFKTGCTVEDTFGTTVTTTNCDDPNVGADIASTDVGLAAGFGVAAPLGTSSVRLDVRYVYGLVKIEKNTDVKNRGFTFGIGYMIPIGR